eukprot:scaffold8.g1366.t1
MHVVRRQVTSGCRSRSLQRRLLVAAEAAPKADAAAAQPQLEQQAAGFRTPDQQQQQQQQGDERPPPLSPEQLERNAALADRLRGRLVLAPLTRGGHLPFRRLCADFGAEVTTSEMAFARQLLRGERKELAILRRAPNEACYGVQIATNAIDEGVAAGLRASEAGANFLDLNVGCPIHEASRRGLGAIMLRKPKKLARLVEGMAARLPIPLTVKIRIGENASKVNVHEVTGLLAAAGAAAVSIHGRTMESRYKKPAGGSQRRASTQQPALQAQRAASAPATGPCGPQARARSFKAPALLRLVLSCPPRRAPPPDWDLISEVAAAHTVPVIGNGDVLTLGEARRRVDGSGCAAVMVGRGALIKPWLFQEFKEGRELAPSAAERVGIYRRLVYRPMPEAVYGPLSLRQPLISTRWEGVACAELGERAEDLPPLERLLRCENEAAFGPMAEALWDSASDAEAVAALERLAGASLAGWEELRSSGRDGRDDERQVEG